jgi:glycolate oxidase FAD binding subunit
MSFLAPAEETEIASIVAASAAEGAPLAVIGQGTKAPAILRPVQAARTLSLAAHRGITLYSPRELVLAARAGTPLAEIEAALAAEGQMLIAEPPDLSRLLGTSGTPTLGGVVACNFSGPRRVALGAVRDHVLGVRAVNGRGEVIRSGGRVLKNVTGLDLCKFLTGSFGTLAVLTEITLKVLPRPPRTATLVLRRLSPEAALAALTAALNSPFAPTGAAYLPEDAAAQIPLLGAGGSATLIRLEFNEASLRYRSARLTALLAAHGPVDTLEDSPSLALWQAVRDVTPLTLGAEDALWRVSVPPSAGARLARFAEAEGARYLLDWGGGLAWIAAPASAERHERLTAAVTAEKGVWWLLRAPPALRASLAVVPPEPPALARLTRAVKAAFDPKGIFGPGRLFAGV